MTETESQMQQLVKRAWDRVGEIEQQQEEQCTTCNNSLLPKFNKMSANGHRQTCSSCGRQWLVTFMGPILMEKTKSWFKTGVPRWLIDMYTFACWRCAMEDGVLVPIKMETEQEHKAFHRNLFNIKCLRCQLSKPKYETEMGEIIVDLWMCIYTRSVWPLVQTLDLWETGPSIPIPYPAKMVKTKNTQRGVD